MKKEQDVTSVSSNIKAIPSRLQIQEEETVAIVVCLRMLVTCYVSLAQTDPTSLPEEQWKGERNTRERSEVIGSVWTMILTIPAIETFCVCSNVHFFLHNWIWTDHNSLIRLLRFQLY